MKAAAKGLSTRKRPAENRGGIVSYIFTELYLINLQKKAPMREPFVMRGYIGFVSMKLIATKTTP